MQKIKTKIWNMLKPIGRILTLSSDKVTVEIQEYYSESPVKLLALTKISETVFMLSIATGLAARHIDVIPKVLILVAIIGVPMAWIAFGFKYYLVSNFNKQKRREP